MANLTPAVATAEPVRESIGDFLRRRLDEEKGNWPQIADESGVPYGTLEKIAQGDTLNPQLKTVEPLLAWFRAKDAMRESLRVVAVGSGG